MNKLIIGAILLGFCACLGCGDGSTVIQPSDYELTASEKANQAKFEATREREHIKEAEENDPKLKKQKASSEGRNYGR